MQLHFGNPKQKAIEIYLFLFYANQPYFHCAAVIKQVLVCILICVYNLEC